ncbi:MAG: hypothetical protein J2P26_05450, partial [Nocardiopsaceae bacterium]|nr:hypothetical protein [Nocardiopsaceae bacterium]
ITAALIDGARITRAGKKVERGITTDGYMFPLLYDGPRDLESMWNGGRSDFVDMRSVSVSGRRIDRCRPRFMSWVLEVVMLLDERVIEEREFREVVRLTGEMEGLGDFRRIFGKFDAQVEVIG